MKSLILSCAFLCGAVLLLQAQEPITLTYDNYGVFQSGDFFSWNNASSTGVELPTTGENQQWDYSSLQNINSSGILFSTPNSTAFPTATVASDIALIVVGNRVNATRYEEISAQGHIVLGQSIEETTIPIDQGIIKGKLVVPAQDVHAKRKEMQFPATYGSIWNTPDTRIVSDARLTVLLYDNTPAQLVQHYTTHDTIVGWGSLSLPGSSSLNVLLHKQTVLEIDSFYIDGTPAPAVLLASLNTKQGDTTLQEYYRFYAANVKGEVLQIARITRQGETTAFVQYNGNLPTSVADQQDNALAFQLYPTPVANTGTVEFDKTSSGTWRLVLHNAVGQPVQSMSINEPAGRIRAALALAPALPNGTYFYTLYNEQTVPMHRGTAVLVR